jgi:hypothetical protein
MLTTVCATCGWLRSIEDPVERERLREWLKEQERAKDSRQSGAGNQGEGTLHQFRVRDGDQRPSEVGFPQEGNQQTDEKGNQAREHDQSAAPQK